MKLSWLTRGRLVLAAVLAAATFAGCSALDEQQSKWFIMPNERSMSWYGGSTEGMTEHWIEYRSREDDEDVRLHALWQPGPRADSPVALYLHGARRTVTGSAFRIQTLRDLGFAVLAVDYRGFGKSSAVLATEDRAHEDARAAWDWLAARHPDRPRYIVGHSLGGAIGVHLAAQVDDAAGVIVEGTFTSVADVFRTMKWGWLPITALITQNFNAGAQVAKVRAPMIVVHGSNDGMIPPSLGRALYDGAKVPKRFVLVEGGTHYSTGNLGREQVRDAMAELFDLPAATASRHVE